MAGQCNSTSVSLSRLSSVATEVGKVLTNVLVDGGWLQMGDANHSNKHDPFYLIQEFPRIIVAPAYRLNLFGFLSCSELKTEDPSRAPGNYGFWDQRTALEWTYDNVTQFGGNPDNISVGGLSAGAYSTIFQLNYDVRRPNPAERLIKQVYLFSNAVGVQPNPVISSDTNSQFDELLSVLEISQLLSPQEKMDTLRNIPASSLIDAIGRLNQHTFRAGTDGDFIHSDFLSDIHSGIFGGILANRGIDVFLGEVADEATLYRLVNPASSYESLVVQLNNYYPKRVTEELLKVYPLPSADAGKEEWADVGARIIGDCQVHATIRGFTAALLLKMPQERVYRYRISWRAKALDDWLEPSVRLCHASDIPIWWSCGRRAGFEQSDLEIVTEWLRPFHHFLNGEKVQHNITKMDQVIELTKEGKVETVQDPLWEWGLQVWEAMRRSQLD